MRCSNCVFYPDAVDLEPELGDNVNLDFYFVYII